MDIMELGKQPIPGDTPAGQDVRSDPLFDALTAEIDKLSSATFSGSIDWGKVTALAREILQEKSKDLLVMTYLCVSLEKSEGLMGLAKGAHIMREALEAFWDDMFPVKRRMRGRKNAIEWLIDTLRDDLPSLSQEQWPKTDRDRFLDDLNAIDGFLAENMEDAPVMIPLINELSSHVVPEEENIAAPTPAAPRPASELRPTPSPVQTPFVSIPDPSDTDAERLLNQGLEVLGRTATLLSQQDPLNPLAFRLNRIAAWTTVTAIPPTTGSKTFIPGPDGQIIGILQNLYQSRSWQDLLLAAESRIRQFLFWLDLNRYVAESLEQLGRQGLSDVIAAETLQYVTRVPGIERLTFEDGTPFADDGTRAWLKALTEKQAVAVASPAATEGEGIRQLIDEAFAEACKLFRENKVNDALWRLNDGLGRAPSAREQILWRQGLCRLLLEMKQPRLALPHLHDLLADIDIHKIEQWEPAIAAEAFIIILAGLRQQSEKDKAKLDAVWNRLATLDPVKAMDFL